MRTLAQFIGVLLVVGFIGAYFWWIVAAAALVAAVLVTPPMLRAAQAQAAEVAARNAELAARADQEHRWVLQGDERGVYGQYPAAL